jgi:hypothetical protein
LFSSRLRAFAVIHPDLHTGCEVALGDPMSPPALKKPKPPKDRFQLLVECRDEAEQRRLYEWLKAQGYSCRVLVM